MSRPRTPEKTNSFSDLARYSNTKTNVTEDGQDRIIGRSVTLHGTEVANVRWDKGLLILNHGGYKTRTTLRRMNEFLKTIDVSYYVRKDDGEFYLWKEFVLDEERDDEIVASFDGNERLAHWL